MRDIHCHILPGVDDGARDMAESLRMWEAAKRAGVTSIVCTPHCRDPYFDFEDMWQAYYDFKAEVGDFPLMMGFEVNHRKLMELGYDWIPSLAFENGREFLLELSTRADEYEFQSYERTIFELQGRGYTVYIAHPERYRAIQGNLDVARRLVKMGCELVPSADFVAGGRLGGARRPAKKLLGEGLCASIASDAHRPEHYAYLAKARKRYSVGGSHFRT